MLIATAALPTTASAHRWRHHGLYGLGIGVGFSVPLSTAIMGLEVIVVIVQAYVFTLLSAVFIGMAIHAHH